VPKRWHRALLLEDNGSWNNCDGTTNHNIADVDLRPDAQDPVAAAGARLANHNGLAPNNCTYGVTLSRRNDVAVEGGSIQAGSYAGIRAWDRANAVIEGVTVAAGLFGIRLDTGLSNFYVQPSASFPGANQEVLFAPGAGTLGDGDSVAHCALETLPPVPQCCDNFIVDPVCETLLP